MTTITVQEAGGISAIVGSSGIGERLAGMLPYATLAGGLVVTLVAYWIMG